MIRWFLGLVCLFTLASAQRVEIYYDWIPDAVGEISLNSTLRSTLDKRYSMRYWDRKAHIPWLLKWKNVKSWDDFKHYLGFGLPRKEALEDDTACLILSGVGLYLRELNLARIPKEKLILFAWEPPTVEPVSWDPKTQKLFKKIYTYDDTLVDNIRFFKFYLPFMATRISEIVPYENRKFLTLIASRLSSNHPTELYSQRDKLIRYFEKRPEIEFDLYGRNWEKRKFRSWKGTVPDKMAALKNYRFAIAYENSTISGYITEKLWDCFAAAVVPVYWGAPNIEDYVPADCFIDRRKFGSDEELVAFLQAMTREEWKGYVLRGETFLHSEAAKKFTHESYARAIAEAVAL